MITLHPRPYVRRAELLPAVLVVVLAVTGPVTGRDECTPSDGPQFRCWLDQQE